MATAGPLAQVSVCDIVPPIDYAFHGFFVL